MTSHLAGTLNKLGSYIHQSLTCMYYADRVRY